MCPHFPRLFSPSNISDNDEGTKAQALEEGTKAHSEEATNLASGSVMTPASRESTVTLVLEESTTTVEVSPLLEGSKKCKGWSMTQAFFVLMGGVIDEKGHILSPYGSRCNVKPTDEEIQDKSKADYFVKFLVLIQTLWFLAVTIYRIQSRVLYATEAEIVTMTFSFLSFFTYLFWWNKPKGVDLPVLISTTYRDGPQDIDFTTPSSIPLQKYPPATGHPLPIPDYHEDAPPPDCFTLAISILESDNTPKYDEFILKSDVYAYVGELSLEGMSIAVLSASSLGSLCGVCHLTIASLNRGLIDTVHGPIWFSLAFIGSTLLFYLLVVISISIGLRACGKEMEGFLRYGLHKHIQWVLLIVSVIGRIALIMALLYFMFTPYDYPAFLEPNWSRYFPHPF